MPRYNISPPGGPAGSFYSIIRDDGGVVALQIPSWEWARRIVAGLTLLEASEKDHSIESYVKALEKRNEGES